MNKRNIIVATAIVSMLFVGQAFAFVQNASVTLTRGSASQSTIVLNSCTGLLESTCYNAKSKSNSTVAQVTAGKYSDRRVWSEIKEDVWGADPIRKEQIIAIGGSGSQSYTLDPNFSGSFYLNLNPEGSNTTGVYANGYFYDWFLRK